MWTTALVVTALSLPLQAPPAEGCDVVCVDAATLQFCDDGEVVTIDCADVETATHEPSAVA